jgi:hypothetical protein
MIGIPFPSQMLVGGISLNGAIGVRKTIKDKKKLIA